MSCLSVSPPRNREPVIMTEMPNPWEVVHIDLYGPLPTGEYILGIIDASTRWPDLHIFKQTTSKIIISKLDITFCTHGYPITIVSDNTPNLTSTDIEDYTVNYMELINAKLALTGLSDKLRDREVLPYPWKSS